MGRRRSTRRRESNGRPERGLPEDKQIAQALAYDMRRFSDRRWRSELGRLRLEGKINDSELAAGERWQSLMAKFRLVICAPAPDPKGMNLQGGLRSVSPDPDTPLGQLLAENESAAARRLRAAQAWLTSWEEYAVRSVCERDENIGWFMHWALSSGLSKLASKWHLTPESRHVK